MKQPEPESIGTVVQIDPSGEFGFIETGHGRELYFRRNSVVGEPKRPR